MTTKWFQLRNKFSEILRFYSISKHHWLFAIIYIFLIKSEYCIARPSDGGQISEMEEYSQIKASFPLRKWPRTRISGLIRLREGQEIQVVSEVCLYVLWTSPNLEAMSDLWGWLCSTCHSGVLGKARQQLSYQLPKASLVGITLPNGVFQAVFIIIKTMVVTMSEKADFQILYFSVCTSPGWDS